MAEKVIRNNQSIVPFFGERLSFIRGLDPLGLQNTSDATFSMLLPGLNNVTGRIRYYSFYCWLLDEYSKTVGNTNPKQQQQFIRRAEYIIALASQYYEGDASSIPGSLYAFNQGKIDTLIYHKLQEGTYNEDGSTKDTYWQYPFGAFGQYYLGSLRDMGIVSNRESQAGMYVRTNSHGKEFISGEELAAAFDENIKPETKRLFFDCLNNGEISVDQLKALLPDFNLAIIPSDSNEQSQLLQLLLQKDYPMRIEEDPSKHRNATIKYLLSYLTQHTGNFNDRIFVYHCYDIKGLSNGETESSLMGWYYYQFNEFWHYANTAILNGTLEYLENTVGPGWQALKPFLDTLTREAITELKKQQLIATNNDTVKDLLDKLEPDEYHFLKACGQNNSIARISNGFLLFMSQYLNQVDELVALKEYSENNDIGKDGEGTTYFITEFAAKKQMTVEQYIFEYLYQHIIYRHQYVAFRKIRGGTQSTQKFIIEDHHIRYLGNFEPGYTGPRLGNLISFLKDLKVISADNALTEQGILLLNNLTNGND